jgi:hypothetical protein
MSFDQILPPPPETQVPSIYERFLLNWWRRHGAAYAVGSTCAEFDIEAPGLSDG